VQKGEDRSRRTEAAAEYASEEAEEQQQCTRSGSGNRGDEGREEVGFCAAFLQIARERERGRGRDTATRPKTRFGLGSSIGSENPNLESEGMYEIDDLSS
jgi:hypothetical protein